MKTDTRIYLDYNATAPVAPEVLTGLLDVANQWGNPSSIHQSGRGPKSFLRESRNKLAKVLDVSALELIFTSGASEANSSVIKSCFYTQKSKGKNVFITTSVEHPSIMQTFAWLETQGAEVHYLKVSREGVLDLETLQSLLATKAAQIALVSIMFANNEVGMIFPIEKITKLVHAAGALMHVDAVQALGKMTFSLKNLDVDYATFSAHKVRSLKGTGLLYVKRNSPYEPLIHGGGQERHRRGGTENSLGIWAFGAVADRIAQVSSTYRNVQALRERFEQAVRAQIAGVTITAAGADRLPNTSSLVIEGVDGETLLMSLDLKGFSVSTGAACSSGNPEPSPVLLAMGLTRAEAQSSLRVSFGSETTETEMDLFVQALIEVVARLRSFKESTFQKSDEKLAENLAEK